MAKDAAVTDVQSQAVIDFWTPERMRQATPMDHISVSSPSAVRAVPRGEPTVIAGTTATGSDVTPLAFPSGGGAWTGGGAVVSTTGRVFFTYQGRTASCSGSAVTSANRSTVMTAGHCVKLDGAFHTNWAFVRPGDRHRRGELRKQLQDQLFPTWMFGPYFGTDAQNVYNTAQSA